MKLPTGAVRYRAADVIAAELAGTGGPLSLDEVCLSVSACPTFTLDQRAAMIEHLGGALERKIRRDRRMFERLAD